MVVLESEGDGNLHFVNTDLLFLKGIYFCSFIEVCVCIWMDVGVGMFTCLCRNKMKNCAFVYPACVVVCVSM